MRLTIILLAGLLTLSGCGIDLERSSKDPCVGVRGEFDEAQEAVDAVDKEADTLGTRPTDYAAAQEWDSRALSVVQRVVAKKRIQARIVVNNRDCFTETDLAGAQEFLEDPLAAARGAE